MRNVIAGQGIRELREGVERAAAGVLGDETEVLRQLTRRWTIWLGSFRTKWNVPADAPAQNNDPAAATAPDTAENESGSPQRGNGQTDRPNPASTRVKATPVGPSHRANAANNK